MRAQGWAEAEKAKAQQNPAAMREHEQIFGQAPRMGSDGRVDKPDRATKGSAANERQPP